MEHPWGTERGPRSGSWSAQGELCPVGLMLPVGQTVQVWTGPGVGVTLTEWTWVRSLTLDVKELDILIAWHGSFDHPCPAKLSGLRQGERRGYLNRVEAAVIRRKRVSAGQPRGKAASE